MQNKTATILAAILIFALCILSANESIAQTSKGLYSSDATSSAWVKSKNASSRLVAANLVSDPENIMGGIEIRLRKNWKTYWRVPGDGGLPPRFDFGESENLEKAEILWPGPNRYLDQYGVAIGYKDQVIFPIKITAKDPQKPVKLHLKLDYAACETICIPLSSTHELTYKLGEPLQGPHSDEIEKFVSQVPVPIKDVKNLKIIGIKFVSKSSKKYLVLDLRSRIGFRQPEIFVEGPEELYFRAPKLDAKPTTVARWYVPISGDVDSHPVIGATVKMTFIDGARRVEADYEIKLK